MRPASTQPLAASTLRRNNSRLAIAMSAVALVALSAGLPDFFTGVNLSNLVQQNAALLAVALGQTFVVIAGGLDVSVGSVVSLTTVILSSGLSAPPAVALAVLAGLCVGLVNGVGVTRFGVHPIIMTLSTMSIVQGATLGLRPVPGGTAPAFLMGLMGAAPFGLPLALFWMTGLAVICGVVLYASAFGLRLYAVGASPANASFAGVASGRIVMAAFMLSSLAAVIAGIQITGRIGSGDPLVGSAFSVDAITAVALGGTLLSGGVGSIGGTVAGVVLLALVGNGMNHLDVPIFYQQLLKGGLLIGAVCVYRRREPGL